MKTRLLFSIIIISFLGVNTSKAQEIQNKIAPTQIENGISRKTSFNLEEIKVRWKKAALENCTAAPCTSGGGSGPGPVGPVPTFNEELEVSSLGSKGAVIKSSLSFDKAYKVKAKGLVWSNEPNPTILLNTKTIQEDDSNHFSIGLTGLNANTTYYVKAYFNDGLTTYYGKEFIFKTVSE
jgi:hypothetical protein